MQIVFWHSIVSPHLSALIRAISDRPDTSVTVVAQNELPEERRALGWSEPDPGTARTVIAPTRAMALDLIGQMPPQTLHVIEGLRGFPLGKFILRNLAGKPVRIGMVSEGPDCYGWGGLVRRCVYTGHLLLRGRRLDFILGMGTKAVRWYAACGFPAERVFPFAYFPERPTIAPVRRNTAGDVVRIIYLGAMIPRKNLETLVSALGGLRGGNWHLSMVGQGPLALRLQRMVRDFGIGGQVDFAPALPHDAAMPILAGSDFFVLPSWHDGWGAVVNEALTLGVPVLCSDHCGAQDLVRDFRGEVFPAGSVAELRRALAARIAAGRRSPDLTDRIQRWADRVQGEAGAEYFFEILDHVFGSRRRPTAPWLN